MAGNYQTINKTKLLGRLIEKNNYFLSHSWKSTVNRWYAGIKKYTYEERALCRYI